MTDLQARIDQLRDHGWRQGSVLPPSVVAAASAQADSRWPRQIVVGPDDWLIVVSHPCDVRNRSAANERFVEVLVARPYDGKKPDSRETYGKNSRRIRFDVAARSAKDKVDDFLTTHAATILGAFVAFADRAAANTSG